MSVQVFVSTDFERYFENPLECYRFAEELDTKLQTEGKQCVVEFTVLDNCFLIGLGNEQGSVLAYLPKLGQANSYNSIGSNCKTGLIEFWTDNQITEFPRNFIVPKTDSFDALHLFLKNGEMPDNIHWEIT